jgi:ABC-2 type transport system ATP-binding protein
MSYAIRTHGLTKHYGGKCVVNALDLRVPRGSVYGLLGCNGSGKSTTIKMLLGLVRPDCGSVELLGSELGELTSATRARIAYLAEGHPLYRWMTVSQVVRFVRGCATGRPWNEPLVEQILDHGGLPRNLKIGRLSAGQRAQVSLALAVAGDPDLLILDDPMLGLDTVVRRDFLASMIQFIQRQGRTILLSSHILSDVERVADRIGILIDGVLRADCPTEHFKDALRKLVLTFAGTPPEFPPCRGLVSCRSSGSRLEVVVANYDDAHRRLAESLMPLSLDVLELNLEDAFIEYTRGPRPPLTLLAPEEPHVESLSR